MPIVDTPAPRIDAPLDTPERFWVTPGRAEAEKGSEAPPRENWASTLDSPVLSAVAGVTGTLGAAFRHDNTLAAWASAEDRRAGDWDYAYKPWDEIKGTAYEPYWPRFTDARNSRHADAIRRQIDNETDDRNTLDALPWYQRVPAEILAGTLDLPSLMPGGAFVRGVKGGYSVARSALNVGVAAGAASGVQEAMLHNIQKTRTVTESAMNIGGAVLLGGALGAGGARLLSAAEWRAATDVIDSALHNPAVPSQTPDVSSSHPLSLGAAALEPHSLDETAVAGAVAGGVAKATAKLNPAMRIAQSPNPVTREVGANLFEMSTYMRGNEDGMASPVAAETLRKEWDGGLMQAVSATRDFYSTYRKGEGRSSGPLGLLRNEGTLSRAEFDAEVGRAMRRGDAHEIPEVQAAAQAWRKNVFDPLKDAAIKAKLLPEDVSVDTAASYFSRMWKRGTLIAEEGQFKGVVSDYYGKLIQREFEKAAANHNRRFAQLDQEKADLTLSPEQRVTALKELETAKTLHEATRFELSEQADQLSDLAGDLRRAKQARGDGKLSDDQYKALVDRTKAERERIIKAGGDDLKTFLEQRSTFSRRTRHVEFGSAGLQERSDRVLGQLADLEETNHRAMQRLVTKGQKLERDLDRLDADALAERIDKLAESYGKIVRQAEAAAERAEQAISNIKKRTASATSKDITTTQRTTTESAVGPPEQAAEKLAEAREARGRISEKQDAAEVAIQKRLEKEAEAQRARAERMDEVAKRLDAAKNLDHDAVMTEVKSAIDKATRETSAASLARGERASRLGERMANLDPERVADRIKAIDSLKKDLERSFYDRWEISQLGEGVDPANKSSANFSAAAKDVADQVFNTLTGRAGEGVRPEFITIGTRGPMKDRTFNIPDELVERWLENDVEFVGRRYQRIMSSDVELANKFGTPDMAEALQKVRDGYDRLRAGVTDPKELNAIAKRERSDLRDLEAVRDIIRGIYGQANQQAEYGHIFRIANSLQYILKMGQVVLSSLTEPVRVVAAKGLLTFMHDGFKGLSNLHAAKLSVEEARLAGNINDKILAHRLSTLADLTDFYGSRGPVEKFMDNATNIASTWNGIRMWTDAGKSLASVMIQNQILKGVENFAKIPAKERRYLAFVGIDESMAGRIAKQFLEHGENIDDIRVANTPAWADEVARRTYRAALNKDIDSMIVTRGAGDVPLFAQTPLGRLILQFNTFNLASHQRILMRGLQEGHARFVGTVMALSTMGMFQIYLSALAQNRLDKLPSMTENPGWWIAEGLDRSGVFNVPMQIANGVEKITGINPIKAPFKAFDNGRAQSTRLANRNELGVLGPSAGTLHDIGTTAGAIKTVTAGEDITAGQKNAIERLVPFNSYLGVRQMIRYLINPPAN